MLWSARLNPQWIRTQSNKLQFSSRLLLGLLLGLPLGLLFSGRLNGSGEGRCGTEKNGIERGMPIESGSGF